jgi:hypothetical protein
MLDDDVCNNSVWSYRYFIVMKTNVFSNEIANEEINYCIQKRLRQNLLNESVWVYMRGLLSISK